MSKNAIIAMWVVVIVVVGAVFILARGRRRMAFHLLATRRRARTGLRMDQDTGLTLPVPEDHKLVMQSGVA